MGIGPQNLGAAGMSTKSKPCGTPLKMSEDSPLAKLSDIVLHIHTHLENNLHIPMTSRLAHLAIIDILSATVQARLGKVFDSRKDEVIKNIEKTRVYLLIIFISFRD